MSPYDVIRSSLGYASGSSNEKCVVGVTWRVRQSHPNRNEVLMCTLFEKGEMQAFGGLREKSVTKEISEFM